MHIVDYDAFFIDYYAFFIDYYAFLIIYHTFFIIYHTQCYAFFIDYHVIFFSHSDDVWAPYATAARAFPLLVDPFVDIRTVIYDGVQGEFRAPRYVHKLYKPNVATLISF